MLTNFFIKTSFRRYLFTLIFSLFFVLNIQHAAASLDALIDTMFGSEYAKNSAGGVYLYEDQNYSSGNMNLYISSILF